ncbi:MAG: PRC-barrel domain-containing protein, partial [Rudaea sp.]
DGEIGHLEDLIFDEESFRINYLVVDTGGWLGGKKVIVPPSWVKDVEWSTGGIPVDLARETIKNSPEFDLESINKRS